MRRVEAIGLLVRTASARVGRAPRAPGNAFGARVLQQHRVVARQITLERVGRPFDTARLERARDELCRTVANHGADLILRNRRRSARDDQRVGGVGDITQRIDQRAVEVEDDELQGHGGWGLGAGTRG